MKLLLILVGMAVAGILGYWMEPGLRKTVTGQPNTQDSSAATTPTGTPSAPVTDLDPATLAPEQLPKEISLKSAVNFADETSGLTMTLAAGSRAKLLRIDGSNAIVRPGSTAYTITVPIAQTDLLEQLAANPPPPVSPPQESPDTPDTPLVPETPPPTQTETAPVQTPATEAAPEPEKTEAPVPAEPEPETLPADDPMTEAAPAPAAETSATPETATPPPTETTPAPTPSAAPPPASVVRVMQDSIRQGQIKEFNFDQVLSWKAESDETIDGTTYQTGLVSYRAETIFGVKNIQAKALIREGRVQRWIWPKSGMEIK